VTAVAFCIPGDIDLPTGGYRYDREVLARLSRHGIEARHVGLGAGFPHPTRDDVSRACAALAREDRRSILLIDGLALGALPPDRIAALPQRVVALVHHPLGLEAGLTPSRERELIENERAALAQARHVIVTSETTRRTLIGSFAVPASRITVAEPGVARADRAKGTVQPVEILSVGAVSARKAYGDLVQALATLKTTDWRLTIVGSLELAPKAVTDLRTTIAASDLGDRVRLVGARDEAELAQLYARADLFAMSSLFEGYGMALSEALARGLPIVTTTGGAAAETVPDAAALKVPPGDIAAIADALGRALRDAALRKRMSDAAWAAAALLPTWDDTAREIAGAIRGL
jgi:glycosyltransferase involved in cell wall biosynthesis